MDNIKLKIKICRKLYYNNSSMWGCFSAIPITNKDKVKLNNFNNIVINGEMPEMSVGSTYDVLVEPTESSKYGLSYKVIYIEPKKMETISEQQSYIKAILPEKQSETIIKAYPNHLLVDLIKDNKLNIDNLNGIGIKRMEQIRNKVLANIDIQEAITELKDLGITFKSMKKLVDHFGSAELVVQKVKDNIYNLCEVPMFSFKKVDAYALNRGDEKENRDRIFAGIKHTIQEEEGFGHSWISISSLIKNAIELLQIDSCYIEDMITELKNNKHHDFYIDEKRVAMAKTYYCELKIKNKLLKLLEHSSNIKVDNVDKKIKMIEEEQGFEFTDEQKQAIQMAIENNVLVLNGKGGTGKSSTVKGIIGAMNNYSYMTCALSGKASKVLSENGLESMTMHRMLGYDPQDKFTYNGKNPLPYHVVVLDETSMVNINLFHSLVDAIQLGNKLIIVGDSGQLSAIGTGAVFRDLLKSDKIPKIELTKVQRQAQKSGILSGANTVRDGKQLLGRYEYGRHIMGELKDFYIFNQEDKETIKDLVLEICKNYRGKDVGELQVITGLKERGDISVVKLNKELQKIFNDKNGQSIKRGKYEYFKNDKVIQSGNNYEAGVTGELSVFNGTLGKIMKIDIGDLKQGETNRIWIKFEGIDDLVPYTQEEMDQIELAYAISVHKSQGSTIKNVIFAFDYSSYMLLSRQFVYTGISRSSKACVMICESGALQHAIKTNHSDIRRTFLAEMLEEDKH